MAPSTPLWHRPPFSSGLEERPPGAHSRFSYTRSARRRGTEILRLVCQTGRGRRVSGGRLTHEGEDGASSLLGVWEEPGRSELRYLSSSVSAWRRWLRAGHSLCWARWERALHDAQCPVPSAVTAAGAHGAQQLF